MLTLSIPAAPRFRRTARQASYTNLEVILPVRLWTLRFPFAIYFPCVDPADRLVDRVLVQVLEDVLSVGGFPERGTGRPNCGRSHRLTFSMSCSSRHYFPTVLPFIASRKDRIATTPEELPSLHERGQAPSSLHRIRRSFRRKLIDWRYRHGPRPRVGRSRIFTGQCCRPFCPGDSTSHSDGPRDVTKYRRVEE